MASERDLTDINGIGGNVILTRQDGKPILVNLFRLVNTEPSGSNTKLIIEEPKAIAGAGTGYGGSSWSPKIEFQTVSCTKEIIVQETPQEIVEKQAAAMRLAR